MITTRQPLPTFATGLALAGIGMRHGFVMQGRANLPVSGKRLAP